MTWIRRYRWPAAAALVAAAVAWPALHGLALPSAASAPLRPNAAVSTPAAAVAGGPAYTLDEALRQAEEHSLQLQLARVQVDRAQLNYEYTLDITRNWGSDVVRVLQMRYNVSSIWPVSPDDRAQDTLRHTAAMGLDQAKLGLDQAHQAARLAITRAYLEWQKATALAQAQEEALARAKAQEASASVGIQAGTASRYDLLAAQAQVGAMQAALTAARSGKESARLALERLVGVPMDPTAQPAADLPGPEAAAALPQADSLVAEALKQRPEAAIARLSQAMKKEDLDLLTHDFDSGTIILSNAQIAAREADLQVQAAEADAALQVRQALLVAASAADRLKALQGAEDQAREALRLAHLRFDAGLATTTEVLGAQSALSQATASRIQAAADLAGALADIQRAAGRR